jgi:hypothetical protein
MCLTSLTDPSYINTGVVGSRHLPLPAIPITMHAVGLLTTSAVFVVSIRYQQIHFVWKIPVVGCCTCSILPIYKMIKSDTNKINLKRN